MKNPIFLLICITALFSGKLSAQVNEEGVPEETKKSRTSGIMGYLSFGAMMPDNADLNTALAAEGFEGLNDYSLTKGGGGFLIVKNFIIGAEVHSMLGQKKENAKGWVRMNGGTTSLRLGYMLFSKPKFFLYPAVGVGSSAYVLNIQEKDTLSTTMGSILSQPGRMTQFKASGLTLDFSANFNLFLVGDGNNGGGLSLGLTAGYSLAPGNFKWKVGEVEVTDPVASTFTGPYLRLNLTGGGIVRN